LVQPKQFGALLPNCIHFADNPNAQGRELIRLRSHVALIRDSYRRLATEFATQLQLIDNAAAAVQGPRDQDQNERHRPTDG
jgi:hypothetical protein